MFVYLSKLLPLFFYPLGVVSLTVILALVFKQRERLQRWLLRIGLIILWLAGNRWVSYGFARSLEWRHLPSENIPTAEVIVLLGGGTEPGDTPRPMVEVNAAGDRVLYAAYLYQQSAAPVILVSGGNVEFSSDRTSTPAAEMTELLLLLGVPASAIWQQPNSQNTYEDGFYSVEILAEKEIDTVILVTSAMHMPRSRAVFEKLGVTVIPAPTDFTITEHNWHTTFHPRLGEFVIRVFPSASALNLTTNVLKEYLGMLIYSLRGWM
ncbi:MAG: YdcF family protein [Chloroflexi bacterium]|nr:YdcF family protein [Chloroflexota bacterium]